LHDLALTTNGSALVPLAKPLHDAGLRRLTVSVDALDDQVFRAMNDVDFPVHRVLAGIDAALEAGFGPIKINMVVKRGVNEQEIVPMARRFAGRQFILRFIEFMDVGNSNHWRMGDVVPAKEIVATLRREFPLTPLRPNYSGEVAQRFRHAEGHGEIGIIASVTQPFCRGCTRARVSSNGQFFTCLFAEAGHDLRALLRSGVDDEFMARTISDIWAGRSDRYSELRSAAPTAVRPKAEMSLLGG
jgi:cyclic pyranopterin phosphate synthase